MFFKRLLKKSNRKPKKILVDKNNDFYNRSKKQPFFQNNIEMCSMHNEVKSLVAKRFIRILKNKIYKYMIPISKNVYIDKLDEIDKTTTTHIIEQLKRSLLM